MEKKEREKRNLASKDKEILHKGKEIQQRMVGVERKINFAQVHQSNPSSFFFFTLFFTLFLCCCLLLHSCVVAFVYIMNKEIKSLMLEF